MCSHKTKTLLISIIGLVVSLLELVITLPYLLGKDTPISKWIKETHNEHFKPAINESESFNRTIGQLEQFFGKNYSTFFYKIQLLNIWTLK